MTTTGATCFHARRRETYIFSNPRAQNCKRRSHSIMHVIVRTHCPCLYFAHCTNMQCLGCTLHRRIQAFGQGIQGIQSILGRAQPKLSQGVGVRAQLPEKISCNGLGSRIRHWLCTNQIKAQSHDGCAKLVQKILPRKL